MNKKIAYIALAPALSLMLLTGCSDSKGVPAPAVSSTGSVSEQASGLKESSVTLSDADKAALDKSLTSSGVAQKDLQEASKSEDISTSAVGTITAILGQTDVAKGGTVTEGKFAPSEDAKKYLGSDVSQKVIDTVKAGTSADTNTAEGRIIAAATVPGIENGVLKVDPNPPITVSSIASKVVSQKIVPIESGQPGYADGKTRAMVISTVEKTVKGKRDNGVDQSIVFTGDYRYVSEYQDGKWVVIDALM